MASTVCSLTDNAARTSLAELFVVLLVTLESCAFKVSPPDEKKSSPSAPKPSPKPSPPAPPASMPKATLPVFEEMIAPPPDVQKVAPPTPPASMAKVPPPAFVEKVAPPAAVQKVAPTAPVEKVTSPAGSVCTSFFVCLLCFS